MLIVLADVMPSGDVPLIVLLHLGKCYCPMADVIATSWKLCLADVVAKWLVLLPLWVIVSCLADVTAKVADGKPIMDVVWQML